MALSYSHLRKAESRHGGKAAGLRHLIDAGVRVPDGIALDVDEIHSILSGDARAIEALENWLAPRTCKLAIRSSAEKEDGSTSSFAGMFATILEIEPTIGAVVEAIKEVGQSGLSDRVLHYSSQQIRAIPVIVQEMVRAKISGVAFSHTILPDGQVGAYIEWVHGLGEKLVSGQVTPASLRIPWLPGGSSLDLNQVAVSREFISPTFANSIISLLERISSKMNFDSDIEWAIGPEGEIYGLQIRPSTTDVLVPAPKPSTHPIPASPGVAAGPARIVDETNHSNLIAGEVLVSEITEADYLPAMHRAAAIVTEEGGLLSHAAIVARELGKPCVVGVKGACAQLKPGKIVNVDAGSGVVQQGELIFGGGKPPELDWNSVYVYDKGIELKVDGVPIYVEPNFDGIHVHIDEDPSPELSRRIESIIRQNYHIIPQIVVDDRRIWYREWRRFHQLRSCRLVESLFESAIAAWNREMLSQAIGTLKKTADLLSDQSPEDQTSQLFNCEAGAALHSLVSVVVEGQAVWSSYRDTEIWRRERGISFRQLLLFSPDDPNLDPFLNRIILCMRDLAMLRNEAYPYFERAGAFSAQYFGGREMQIRAVCEELELDFISEDQSLSELYDLPCFNSLDKILSAKVISIIESS